CVRERKGLIDVGVFINVVAAVELITDRVLSSPVGRKRHCARKGLGCPLVRTSIGGVDRSRHQQRQSRCVAAVERQLCDALLFDDLVEGRGRRIYLHGVDRHLNDLVRHAELHLHIYRQRLVCKQSRDLLGKAETLSLGGNGIVGGVERGDHEGAIGIGNSYTRKTGAYLGHGDFGGRDGGSSGVSDRTQNAPQPLCVRDSGKQESTDKANEGKLLHGHSSAEVPESRSCSIIRPSCRAHRGQRGGK